MPTPLIKTLNTQSGTFYTFSSGTRDITQQFQNDGIKFSFSKFACVKIPNIKTPLSKKNDIQFDTIDGAIINSTNLSDNNLSIAESFQNYALNFESLILEQPTYDSTIKSSVSERLFFKWLKELGGIRFRDANSFESVVSRFVEENSTDIGSQQYENVVKYIGDLQVVNSVKRNGDVYSQIYINIPTVDGGTPVVLFNTISDANYYPSMSITSSSEFISGRDGSSTHPAGLSLSAFYDYDDFVSFTGSNELWMGGTPQPNTYYTEPVSFTNAANTEITKIRSDYGLVGSDISYVRSKLDGVSIDWDLSNYADIVNSNNTITTLTEYNRTGSSKTFEFNAILVYYDFYDISNPTNKATNLYGVLFLDNIETTVVDGGFIKPFIKFKHNPITKLNGNSYGLKLNLKFDSTFENAAIETVINDYDSYSLNLFSDALNELKQSSQYLMESKMELMKNLTQIQDIQNLPFFTDKLDMLATKVASLEVAFSNANLMINDAQSLIDAVGNLSSRLDLILNGQTPVSVSVSYSNLVNADGIGFDVLNNKLAIRNKNQRYSNIIQMGLDFSYGNANEIKILPFTNLFVETTSSVVANDIVTLNIDDSLNPWKTGQTYELSFNGVYDMNGFNIIIKTDKSNKFNSGVYGKIIGSISSLELNTKSKYQIICLDEFNYQFLIEKLN